MKSFGRYAIESKQERNFRFLRREARLIQCGGGVARRAVILGKEADSPWSEKPRTTPWTTWRDKFNEGGPAFHGQPLATRIGRGEWCVRAKGCARSACIRAFRERKRPSFNLLGDAWLIYKGKRNPSSCSLRCRTTRREKGLETQARGFLRCVRSFRGNCCLFVISKMDVLLQLRLNRFL